VTVETMRTEVEVLSPQTWEGLPADSTRVSGNNSRWYFVFFFISGFCSILYELIWLRLAMAQFGVTIATVSIVLSTFMAGLGVGSWAAGYLVRTYGRRLTSPPLHLYAIAELFIGCSAVVVQLELLGGHFLLEHLGSSLLLSSSGYYIATGAWLALSLIPWSACMGATIPLAMFAIRSDERLESRRSFSFLYLANVVGAMAGTLIPLLFIEAFGFTSTLRIGMALNLAIFAAAMILARKQSPSTNCGDENTSSRNGTASLPRKFADSTLGLLFLTGLTSMGMEVVWTRQYTPYVSTFVYSFATILAVYLAATFIGSTFYRVWSRRNTNEGELVWLIVWLVSLLPLLTADPRLGIAAWVRVPLGIAGFSGLLGFLTPMLVDRFSQGDPDRAGIGYAVNVLGCILGPIFAGFALLPRLDERQALVALSLPWLLVGFPFRSFRHTPVAKQFLAPRALGAYAVGLAGFSLILGSQSYEQRFAQRVVRRDSTATVIATGQGMKKQLIVNGVNMTILTPITKLMASIPLAFLDHPPRSALVICLGMGTTYRSTLAWGIDSTAVDLIPSVPKLFRYYHADGSELLKLPRSHVIIDDGRRFLERTAGQYDVIIIDPPPPIQAAGSSLLYSREFYSAAKKRLRPDGILQQWFPGGDLAAAASVSRALKESFPYVRAFISIEGWGVHYLASQQPIPNRSAVELAKRMPASAEADLVEWGPFPTAEQQFAAVLKNEVSINLIIALDAYRPALQDDRPINEYYLLRDFGGWLYGRRHPGAARPH
jgi:spermidine synthase